MTDNNKIIMEIPISIMVGYLIRNKDFIETTEIKLQKYWDTLIMEEKKELIVIALQNTFEKYSIKDINSVLNELKKK